MASPRAVWHAPSTGAISPAAIPVGADETAAFLNRSSCVSRACLGNGKASRPIGDLNERHRFLAGLFQWHLISSFYADVPWPRCGLAVANQPWAGAYEITRPAWAVAHTTQFASPGWRYLGLNQGVSFLEMGGSYVTRISPDGDEFSIVIEKMSWRDSPCARPNNQSSPYYQTEDENVTIIFGSLEHQLLKRNGKKLYVWRSNLTEGASEANVFQQLAPIVVDVDVAVNPQISVSVHVNEIFTLTTLSTGRKGSHKSQQTKPGPLPLPYRDDFEGFDYRLYQPPKLFYDQQGAWEIDVSRHGRPGRVMRQVTNSTPVCWGSCGYNGTVFTGPWSEFGPALGDEQYASGMSMSFDVFLEEEATLQLRLGNAHGVQLDTNGSVRLDGRFSPAGSSGFSAGAWHRVELSCAAGSSAVAVDNITVLNASAVPNPAPWEFDARFPNGGWEQDPWVAWSMGPVNQGGAPSISLSRYIFAEIDNFLLAAGTRTERGL